MFILSRMVGESGKCLSMVTCPCNLEQGKVETSTPPWAQQQANPSSLESSMTKRQKYGDRGKWLKNNTQ